MKVWTTILVLAAAAPCVSTAHAGDEPSNLSPALFAEQINPQAAALLPAGSVSTTAVPVAVSELSVSSKVEPAGLSALNSGLGMEIGKIAAAPDDFMAKSDVERVVGGAMVPLGLVQSSSLDLSVATEKTAVGFDSAQGSNAVVLRR